MAEPDTSSAALGQLLVQQAAKVRNDETNIPLDEHEALANAASLRGKVVVVTGSGSGFGKEYALLAASYGAKLVLSDIRLEAVEAVRDEIKRKGGEATATVCNVLNWEDQVAMFRHGVNTYGVIDVVVANAGIAEIGARLMDLRAGPDGEPTRPGTKTLEVNITGVAFTCKLAFFHLSRNPAKSGKAITILGSMASYFGLPGAPLYSTSKHAVLGMMRSLQYDAGVHGIVLNSVHPWFVKTNIFGAVPLLLLAGIPLATVPEVVNAMIAATTRPDANGSAFIVDFKGVLQIPRAADIEGTHYAAFANRSVGLISWGKWIADSIAAFSVAITRRSLN